MTIFGSTKIRTKGTFYHFSNVATNAAIFLRRFMRRDASITLVYCIYFDLYWLREQDLCKYRHFKKQFKFIEIIRSM